MSLFDEVRSGKAEFCDKHGHYPTTVHLTNHQLIALISELVWMGMAPRDIPESDQPFEVDGMVIRISEAPGPHFTDRETATRSGSEPSGE